MGGGSGGDVLVVEEVKVEKMLFDVKLEKFDVGFKIKIIKEVCIFMVLGLKEVKEFVEKVLVVLKLGVGKEEVE